MTKITKTVLLVLLPDRRSEDPKTGDRVGPIGAREVPGHLSPNGRYGIYKKPKGWAILHTKTGCDVRACSNWESARLHVIDLEAMGERSLDSVDFGTVPNVIEHTTDLNRISDALGAFTRRVGICQGE